MSKSHFFDKVMSRLERLDRSNVESWLVRLSQEKGLLESIFNSMLEGIVVTGTDLKVIFVNDAARTFLEVPGQSLLHQDLAKYLEWLDLGELAGLIAHDWGKLIHRDVQVDYPHPRTLHLNVFPLVSAENAYLGLVLIVSDVTRRRREELEQLRNEKFQTVNLMAACIAHEIGNPLNAIDIHLQLLERDIHGHADDARRKDLQESVHTIRSEIRRMDHIVRSFLAAARPMRPNLNREDIHRILDETLHVADENLAARKIVVKTNYDRTAPKILLDEFQMKQAFSNLIKNAYEAMPHGGLLKIATSVTGDDLKIAFEDNGEGIRTESFGKIFEPYYTTKSTGSGLGLMISYRIIKEHGGRIEVVSQEGAGSTFTISLPLGLRRKMKLLPERQESV